MRGEREEAEGSTGATDAGVGYGDVDVVFGPWLGLEGLPDHIPLYGRGVVGDPTFEFGVRGHCDC